MKSLADARAELARLQRRESELRKELSDACEAVAEQKIVIDKLIKASAIPYIDRLPTELLAQIFLIVKDERHILASVSRRWRAVLTDTPEIWGEIYIWDYYSCPWLLELHLERSRQTPLSIIAHLEDELLDVVLPHEPPRIVAAELLEELSLDGNTSDWIFEAGSMPFPLLQRLTLDISDPIPLLEAIVAPQLTYFRFSGGNYREPMTETMSGNWSKFNSVTHLSVASSPYGDILGESDASALFKSLWPMFRGTRHADIHVDYMSIMFCLYQMVDDHHLTDYWTCLENLEIRDFKAHSSIEELNILVDWFARRRDLGQQKLHFKLIHEHSTADSLYQTLQEYCASVVLDHVPVYP
ncbi:hypothetical protein EDC04DRAFT_2896886 [Pisolithus marmoratus]|nr:hypothetical protein EDC04DRAFT_2896886 [Pisolithus marmoratus]